MENGLHRIRIFLKIYHLRLFLSKTNHQISKTTKVPIFGSFLTLLDKYENYLRRRDNNNKPKRQRRQLLSYRHSGNLQPNEIVFNVPIQWYISPEVTHAGAKCYSMFSIKTQKQHMHLLPFFGFCFARTFIYKPTNQYLMS